MKQASEAEKAKRRLAQDRHSFQPPFVYHRACSPHGPRDHPLPMFTPAKFRRQPGVEPPPSQTKTDRDKSRGLQSTPRGEIALDVARDSASILPLEEHLVSKGIRR
jgi:hypothetical protein